MRPKKAHSKGFSIIELLFAMIFMTVIVMGIVRLQTSNLTLSNTKRLELKAHFYAGQALEIVDALGAGGLDSSCEEPIPPTNPDPCSLNKGATYTYETADSEDLGEGFSRSLLFNADSLTGARLVTATVTWQDTAGDHSVSAKKIIIN